MPRSHHYQTQLRWTGNTGKGTEHYRSYERSYTVSVKGKPEIAGSSDPVFRGDRTRYNPEEMLVAALSACHMLFFLHFCADGGVVVLDYDDTATGTMEEDEDGRGRFTRVLLKPRVKVKETSSMIEKMQLLHARAHEACFIANSCNFPVCCEPYCRADGDKWLPVQV
jgi:organic hydroperoxide reductase OsmC/OhrA